MKDEPASSNLRTWVAIGFVLVALTAAILAVTRDLPGLREGLRQLRPWDVLLSSACGIAGLGATFFMWRRLLVGLGATAPVATTARMFFIAQLGKYLPGSVWPMIAQVEYGRRLGLDRKAVLAANLLSLTHGVGTGLALGGVLVLASPGDIGSRWLVVVCVPVGLALLHPAIVLSVLNWMFGRLHRAEIRRRVGWRAVVGAAVWGFLAWLLFGIHLLVLLRAMGTESTSALLVIGGFALATCAGIVALPAPAGVGVRDGLLIALLSTAGSDAGALAAGIMSRVVLTIADVSLAGLALARSWVKIERS